MSTETLILYNLESEAWGLLSKRGSRQQNWPLEIHCGVGTYFQEGAAYFPDYIVHV